MANYLAEVESADAGFEAFSEVKPGLAPGISFSVMESF